MKQFVPWALNASVIRTQFFRQARRSNSYIQRQNALQLATVLTGSLVMSPALMVSARAQSLTGDVVANNGDTINVTASSTPNSVTNNGGEVLVETGGVTLTTNFVQQGGETRVAAGGVLTDTDGVIAISGGEVQNNGGGTISSAVSVSGGTLTASGGTFGGNVTISGTGTFNVDGSASVGTTTMTGGNIDVDSAFTLQTDLVQGGGTTTIRSGGTLTDSDGTTLTGGTIANSGTITNAVTVTGGTLTNTTGGTVNGLTTVQSGTLNASGGTFVGGVTAQGGTVNITTSQTLDLTNNGSVININTGVNLTDELVNNSGTLNIAGTLIGNLTNSAAVFVTGTITGNVINNSSLNFNRSDALTYGGVISGTGSLSKSGAGTLTLTGTNTQTGGTTISAGTLQIGSGGTSGSLSGNITNNAALIFNRSDALTYGGAISGTGSLSKTGAGTLTLTGTNTHTGGTTISAGRLVVNGRIGATTLNGGTVGGSGTLGNVTANSGSTIAPGNSIGTLNVAGNVSFAAGSTYDVEVDSAGNSDKIAATGTVTIDSGAAVKILAENGTDNGSSYAPSTTYTIITAGTAVIGTFGTVNENFAFLDADLSYGATSVTLDLIRNDTSFADVARTTNQRAVAGSLSGLASTSDLYRAVAGLNETQARRAYDSLSGEIHASLPSMFLNDSARLRDTVTSRIHDAFAGFSEMPEIAFNGPVSPRGPGLDTGSGFNLSTWGSAYGAYGKLDGDGNAATLSRSTGGALVGFEATAWPQARFGLLAGLGQSQASVSARASSADANSYTLGAYGGVRLSDLGLTFGAAYSWHDVTSERAVAAGGLKDTLTADYWSRTAQVFGEASYALETPWLQVSPFAGLALLHQQTDAFQEQGSAALALTGDGSSQLLGSSTLGLRMSKTLATTDGISAALTGALGWRHAIGDLTPDQRMALSGLDPFTVQGVPLDRDTALIEAGLALTITDRTTLGLSYQGAFGENARDQGANARVNIRF